MKIYIRSGLERSIQVFKHFKRITKSIKGVEVTIGCFHNCREVGYTFMVSKDNGFNKSFTFLVYEHRNSDSIIVNRKEGHWSHINGDELPFRGESKWEYWAAFGPDQAEDAARYLAEEVERFCRTGEVHAHPSGALEE